MATRVAAWGRALAARRGGESIQNPRTCEFSRAWLAQAGTRQPAARRSQACLPPRVPRARRRGAPAATTDKTYDAYPARKSNRNKVAVSERMWWLPCNFTPAWASEIPNFIFISRSANAAPGGTAASAPGTEPRPPRRARADDTTSTPPRAAACSCPRHAAVDSAAAHGRAPHVSSGWCAEPGGQGGLRHRARPVWTRRRVSELLRSRAKAGTRLRRAPARGAGDDALRVCSPDSNPGLADPRHYSHV